MIHLNRIKRRVYLSGLPLSASSDLEEIEAAIKIDLKWDSDRKQIYFGFTKAREVAARQQIELINQRKPTPPKPQRRDKPKEEDCYCLRSPFLAREAEVRDQFKQLFRPAAIFDERGHFQHWSIPISRRDEAIAWLQVQEHEVNQRSLTARAPENEEQMMSSRFHGSCRICGKEYQPGTTIFYSKALRKSRHYWCEEVDLPPDAIVLTRDSALEGDPFHLGEVLSWKGQYLYVMKAFQQYFPDDGLSFGLENNEGTLYTAWCREATEEESFWLRQRESMKRQIRDARHELKEIAEIIRRKSTLPARALAGQLWKGEEINIGDRNDGKGRGSWFAVTEEWLIFVENNGAWGDNWRLNNYLTKGAGGIAWGIPLDEALLQQIQDLAQIVDPLEVQTPERPLVAWSAPPIENYANLN